MKTISCFFAIAIFSSFSCWGQNKILFSKLDPKEVLTTLFNVQEFGKGEVGLWKPSAFDLVNMPISDDGFCRTSIDTIIYTTSRDFNYAIVIFKTQEYMDGSPNACKGCPLMLSIATFEQIDKNWELKRFKKVFTYAGTYGQRDGHFEIRRLGSELNCLYYHTGLGGGQGYFSGYGVFYNLEIYSDYEVVFQYRYHDSNIGAVGEKGYTEETAIKILEKGEFYTIELLTVKETNGKKGALKKRQFVFSEEHDFFMPLASK